MPIPFTTHAFVSAKTDGGDATLVRPSNWNAAHVGNGLGYFSVIDYGALGDGSTDDTTAFNAAITAANTAGGGVVFVPENTYIVANVTLKSYVILRGSGYNSILKLKNSTTADVIKSAAVNAATAIVYAGIEFLRVDGNKSNQSNGVDLQQNGISLNGASDCWAYNIWVHDTQRSAVYMAGARNRIENSTVWAIGKVGAAGSIIGRQGFQFDAYGVTEIYPVRSICRGNRVLDTLEHGIKIYSGGTGSIVSNNVVLAAADRGIYIQGANYCTVSGNTVDGASVVGIYIGDTTLPAVGTTVTGNVVNGTLLGTSGGHGILIWPDTRTVVSGNVVTNCYGNGIYILSGPGCSVTGNFCHGNGTGGGSAGISFYQSPNGAVTGNTCSNNGTTGSRGTGILFWDGGTANTDITITGNRCYDTGAGAAKVQAYGIESRDASNYLTVASNALRGNFSGTHTLVGANNVYTAGAV